MGCLKNILLLTALFVFSPFLSIEARGGMDVSRESDNRSDFGAQGRGGGLYLHKDHSCARQGWVSRLHVRAGVGGSTYYGDNLE